MGTEFSCQSEAVLLEPLMTDTFALMRNVSDVNSRRSAAVRDGCCHETLYAATEDQHGLSDQIRALDRVHGVPKRIHKSNNRNGKLAGAKQNQIGYGYLNVLGESAVFVHTLDNRISTNVPVADAALIAPATGDVHLGRNLIVILQKFNE